MDEWNQDQDDREPYILPDGRTVMIKHTFVISSNRPIIGRIGIFRPNSGVVLWSDGTEEPCLWFGGGPKALDSLREHAAILPQGRSRERAHQDYLKARKYIWEEMIGRVISIEGGGEDEYHVWVVGVEEALTADFEIASARASCG